MNERTKYLNKKFDKALNLNIDKYKIWKNDKYKIWKNDKYNVWLLYFGLVFLFVGIGMVVESFGHILIIIGGASVALVISKWLKRKFN